MAMKRLMDRREEQQKRTSVSTAFLVHILKFNFVIVNFFFVFHFSFFIFGVMLKCHLEILKLQKIKIDNNDDNDGNDGYNDMHH